ncbi:amino acid efflux transporter [Micromonospora narathiwatensis]|uniref:Amino acid efflux transporter n=1 Tax=Micromonospora narathiwatensis TaxID=299146 RepID=A0A1A8ZA07_9ACTN|nr:amino acid efflux transporter [Micromonospora narathiwatensis]
MLIAASFGALGARYPDAGGVATFTRRAFGAPAAAVVGCWLYAAVPVGVVAGAVAGARYTAAALDASPTMVAGISAVLLAAVYGANLMGLRLSGRLQLALTATLVALLVAVIAVAGPRVDPERLTPFAPHGAAGVGSAAAVLFAAICGWEATANLSAEFTHPRQVRRAAIASLSVVIVLYSGLAVCTVGVLGDTAGGTPVPLMHLLGATGRPWAAGTVAVLAVLLTFGASFTFVAAGARAGVALARHHVLPAGVAVTRQGVPLRSVAVQAAAGAVVAVIATVAPGVVTVDLLVRVFAALLACVTVVGLAAAVRLLPVPRARVGAAVAALAVAVIAALSGPFLFAPAAVAAVVLARLRRHPSPATATRATGLGIDRRDPLGEVLARRTAAKVGIR